MKEERRNNGLYLTLLLPVNIKQTLKHTKNSYIVSLPVQGNCSLKCLKEGTSMLVLILFWMFHAALSYTIFAGMSISWSTYISCMSTLFIRVYIIQPSIVKHFINNQTSIIELSLLFHIFRKFCFLNMVYKILYYNIYYLEKELCDFATLFL